MGQGLKNLGNIYSGIFDPAGVVTGKSAGERLFGTPKQGESIAGEAIMGPSKAWKPKDSAGIALSQPVGAKGKKQYLGNVSGTGFLGTK